MNKLIRYFLYLFTIFFISFVLISCEKEKEVEEETKYPEVNILDYIDMEKYETSLVKDEIKYEYIFYFDDDKCMNALVNLTFDSSKELNEYYESIKDNEEYIEISVEKNVIKYYHNPEYFIYMMYSKEMIIDLFKKDNLMLE